MRFQDAPLVVFLFLLVFGPPTAFVVYGFKGGKKAFDEKLREVGSPLQARRQAISTSLKVAIVPALGSLFGGIRARVARSAGADEDVVWLCVGGIGLALIVLVIVPFMLGVQRAYRLATAERR